MTNLNSLIESKRNYSKKYSELVIAMDKLRTEQEDTLTAIVKEAQQSDEGIDVRPLCKEVDFDGHYPVLVEAIRVTGNDCLELKVNLGVGFEWVSIYDFYIGTAEEMLFAIMETI